jgi:hypothetical protein
MKIGAVIVATLALLSLSVASVAADDGSRDQPHPFGEAVTIGDYELKVVDTTPDATQIILDENQFNEMPQPGNIFFMIRVEATYHGTSTGDAWDDLAFSVVGDQNLGYSTSNAECGVVPDPGYDAPELFTDGTAEFDVCWSVPAEEVGSLVLYVEPDRSSGDDRAWLSLNPATATPQA